MSEKNEAREFLRKRKAAYRAVFDPESEPVLTVIKDLALFCRATQSTFHTDPRTHALLEGRREVFLRVLDHINLTDEQQLKLYGGQEDG